MASAAILHFLEENIRPFSFSDIQNGVKGDFEKSALQKALNSLVENERVKEKVYGKQKVYFMAQNTDVTSKDLEAKLLALDRQINETTSKLTENAAKIKINQGKFEELRGRLTLSEALEKKRILQIELNDLKGNLKKFEGVDPINSQEKEKVQQNYDRYLSLYKKRKRLCVDMLDAILENYPKTKKHLYEDIGIETDEDAGFKVENN